MYCTNCGKEVSDETKFCPHCGGAQGQAGMAQGDVHQANRNDGSSMVAQRTVAKRSRAPIIAIVVVICACAVAGIVFLPGLLSGGNDGAGGDSPSGNTIASGNDGQAEAESQSAVSYSAVEEQSDDNVTEQTEAAPQGSVSAEPLIAESAAVGDVVEIADSKYKWRILGKTDDKVLLITDGIVDMRSYNDNYDPTTWAECSLRKWLNEDFFNTLPLAMQPQISETNVVNDDNPEYDTGGGEDTLDKIFCLSIDEANEYFSNDEDRITYLDESGNNWSWWLRSSGNNSNSAAIVNYDGGVINIGNFVYGDRYGFRPALWLNL